MVCWAQLAPKVIFTVHKGLELFPESRAQHVNVQLCTPWLSNSTYMKLFGSSKQKSSWGGVRARACGARLESSEQETPRWPACMA